jgi:plastocyanin
MNKKKYLITIGVSFVIGIMIYLLNLQTIFAEQPPEIACGFVQINGKMTEQHKTIMFDPKTIKINKGDCVVWFNRVYEKEVLVAFEEGKKCKILTQAPVGYKLNKENNCYVSMIPFAGTSSLRFMEKGTYNYVATIEDLKDVKASGQIIVGP